MATDEMTLRDMRALEMRQIELERQKRKSKMNNNIDKKTLGELIQFHQQQIAANQRQIDELRGQFEPEPLPEVKPMFGQALGPEDAKALLTQYGDCVNTTEFSGWGVRTRQLLHVKRSRRTGSGKAPIATTGAGAYG